MSLISTENFYKIAQEKTEWVHYKWAVSNLKMPPSKRYQDKGGRGYYLTDKEDDEQLNKFMSDFLVQKIHTGGYRGGNCWDNTQPWYESSDEKVDFSILKDFLLEVYPELTLKQFAEIQEKFVKTFEDTEYEYYGNTSEYTTFVVNLNDLYTYLAGN